MLRISSELLKRFVEAYLREFELAPLRVIDVGSRLEGDDPDLRSIFSGPQWRYLRVDVAPEANADLIVAATGRWDVLDDAAADVVVCAHALQRFAAPWEAMCEVSRILRPGGLVCLVVPSADSGCCDDGDRWRIHADGARALASAASLRVIELFAARGLGKRQDISCLLQKPADPAGEALPAFPAASDKQVARRLYLESFHARPPDARYYLNVARLMLEVDRPHKAAAALRIGLEVIPGHAELELEAARLAARLAQGRPALADALAALCARPSFLEAVLAAARFLEGASASEREQFRQAVAGDGAHLRNIAALAETSECFKLAALCYEVLASTDAADADALLDWALNLRAAGSDAEAKALFRRAREVRIRKGLLNRAIVVQRLVWTMRARTYLEIGVDRGRTLLQLEVPRKFAVDPCMRIPGGPREADGISFHCSTSDAFFGSPPRELLEGGVDVVLVDDVPTADHVLRDVENSLRYLRPGGVIVVAGCCPASEAEACGSLEEAARTPGFSGVWTGDTYRAIVRLRAVRRDLFVSVLDVDRGIAIITRGQPEGAVSLQDAAIDTLTYAQLRIDRVALLNLKPAVWLEAWLLAIDAEYRRQHNACDSSAPAASLSEVVADAARPARIARPRPFRRSTPGVPGERVVFVNNFGGIGDTFPIPLFIQWYKRYYPQDTTVLYDSQFVHHYFEPFPGIDEFHREGIGVSGSYLHRWLLEADPSLPRGGGVPLSETRFTRLVSTHHAHRSVYTPAEIVIKMDYVEVLADIVSHDFSSFDMRLRPTHTARVDTLFRELTADGRILIGMQTRGACPWGGLQVPRERYVRELTMIAEALVDKYRARVLICGDDRLLAEDRYARHEWVALDELVPNVYYKLELMKRTRLYLAATSGFSIMVNLLRGPDQIPAVQIYTEPKTLRGESLTRVYPNYEKDGGSLNTATYLTFRHRDLEPFLFGPPHTPARVLAFIDRFMR